MIPNIISTNWLLPFVAQKNDFSRAIRGLRGMPRRLLLIGYKGTVGVAETGRVININSAEQADTQFGPRSMLALMWRAAKANAGAGLPIDCIAVVASGSGATATMAFSNAKAAGQPMSSPGRTAVYVGHTRYAVAWATGDTAPQIAQRVADLINADANRMVVAAINPSQTNQINFTFGFPGEVANGTSIREGYFPEERLADELAVTYTNFSGGTGTPDLSQVASAMVGYRATEIVCPFNDSASMAVLEEEMERRWNASNMQDGQVITAVRGNEATLNTWLTQRNSPHVHALTSRFDLTPAFLLCCMAGAAIESLAAIDPSLPVTGVKLVGFLGPINTQRMTDDEANALLAGGGMSLRVAQDGTGYLQRAVTTYNQTLNGAADRSMAELAWIKTMSYYRWYHVTEFQIKYQGFKLAQYLTEPIPGQKIMTAELAEEIMIGLYKNLCDAGICQNTSYYKDTLLIEIDAQNGRLKIVDEPVIITQQYGTEITSYVVAGQV